MGAKKRGRKRLPNEKAADIFLNAVLDIPERKNAADVHVARETVRKYADPIYVEVVKILIAQGRLVITRPTAKDSA